MAKDKVKGGPAQRHLHSRVSYLYQAATYLTENAIRQSSKDVKCVPIPGTNNKMERDSSSTLTPIDSVSGEDPSKLNTGNDEQTGIVGQRTLHSSSAMPSQRLLAHVRTILRKSQIRLAPSMKHSICKRCDALLLPGSTSTISVENKSKYGNKPWADVLVVICCACGTAKRYPVGAKRQLKRQERPKATKNTQGIADTQASKASSDQPNPS